MVTSSRLTNYPLTTMSTFTQIYYHLVFSTKARERVLMEKGREEFFRAEFDGIPRGIANDGVETAALCDLAAWVKYLRKRKLEGNTVASHLDE